MNLENSKKQLKRGVLEYCILSILNAKQQYSADIINRIKKADLIVVEGTLYPLLTRLKNDGLLNYKWVESNQGPPRKYYEITENGKSFLDDLTTEWKQLVKSVNNINKIK